MQRNKWHTITIKTWHDIRFQYFQLIGFEYILHHLKLLIFFLLLAFLYRKKEYSRLDLLK